MVALILAGKMGSNIASEIGSMRITEQIDAMDKWEGSQLNEAKDILAYELTNLVHGEEEAAKAIDMGGYYRVPADNRDLNYDKYFVEGKTEEKLLHQYNSHNTERLDVAGTIAKMKTTDYIKEELAKLGK